MIIYESNKNWLKDVSHLTRSWTMQRVLRSSLLVMALTTVVCVFYIDVFKFSGKGLDTSVFSLLGIVLSILLAFRTSTAYDRWWEGRKNWGQLVNESRNLAIYLQTVLPENDRVSRQFFINRISNFAVALKEHLRKGTKPEELVATETELALYRTKNHLPSFITLEIINKVQVIYKSGQLSPEDHLNIKTHTQEFMNICGACERIKKTPIPFSYNVYLKLFITVYAVLLPFALMQNFGYWTILMTGFVFFAFIGLELMAEEIEDPFGLDCNDLPTGAISENIRNNVTEVFEMSGLEQPQEKERQLYEKVF